MSDDTGPEAAIASLGNETRVAILPALAASWDEAGFGLDFAHGFSELQRPRRHGSTEDLFCLPRRTVRNR